MAERTSSKPASTCRSWSKRSASLKCLKQASLDRLKQALNKVETLFGGDKEGFRDYPVPTSPPGCCARTPGGQHDYEATGSNHTSNHTSEYFDAKDPWQLENLLQHQIPDYDRFDDARLRNRRQYGSEQGYEHVQQGIEHPQSEFSRGSERSQFGSEHPQFGTEQYQNGFEHLQQEFGFERPHPGPEEQLSGYFGNILLNTPTASHASHPHPWDDHLFLNPVAPVSVHHDHEPPVPENYYSGELNPSWFQLDDATGSHATSTAQQQQTTIPGYGGMSVRTGETGDSRESLMDTAGTSTTSPYILRPVAEEKPSFRPQAFNKIYVDLRRFTRGDEVAFASARMGRGMRVLGKALWYTRRLRKTVTRVKAQRKRIRDSPQRQQKPSQRWKKRMRPGSPPQPMAPGVSTQSPTERRYKGVTQRNDHWVAEIRVSACKEKVWIGTFPSEKKAALALDAGYYHCTEKHKKFHFPEFMDRLGESQYQKVLRLCNEGGKEEAKRMVKQLAAAHAAEFGAP